MIEPNSLLHGDCLEVMKDIEDGSVDLILTDLPYGTTKNKWDSVLPLEELWLNFKRVINPRNAIVLFAQTPFDKVLGASNLEMLKYEWIWNKKTPTGYLNSNFAPLKLHENILVFSNSAAAMVKDKYKAMIYNPQFSKGKPYKATGGKISENYDINHQTQTTTENDGSKYYPKSIIDFTKDSGFHPTQKPVALLEYLIKTYTNEGDLVLDATMGSGSTCVACVNTNRKYLGIEKEQKYYDIAVQRVEEAKSQLTNIPPTLF